jgi:thioredoxin-dependent peroxiredoxin
MVQRKKPKSKSGGGKTKSPKRKKDAEMIKEGEKAPDFRVPSDSGKEIALSDYTGRDVVLYFYPKADTPGCTNESKEFRDVKKDFDRLGASILGCSADSVAAQAKFKKKYDLNFPLLADQEFKVIEAYGARRMKSFLGRTFLGIVRSTVWIGADGKIRKAWPNASSKGHAAEVLAAVQTAQ